MRPVYVLLIVVVTLGVALLTVSFVHPGGLEGLQEDLFGAGGAEETSRRGGDDDGETRNGSSPADAAKELQQAHAAYDRGDFDFALTMYRTARSFAAGEAERRAANEGFERALLASSLLVGSPRTAETGDAAQAEFDRLKQAAEARPTEEAWLAVARYGRGAGIEKGLPYVVERALESAQAGGPVETLLRQSAGGNGRRGRALSTALKTRGLNGDPLAPVASTDDGREPWKPDGDEETPSGIGGVGNVKVQRIPYGSFSDAMRERMQEAVQLEAKGEAEWRAATPGRPEHASHRKQALEYLRAARTVFSEALDEDPKAIGLERRLQAVNRMIYELQKDATIND